MKRILSIFLAMALAAVCTGVTAFADDTVKIRQVRVYSPTYTVRVDRTLQLEERVYPDDADYDHVEWLSSDYNIAEVDDDGEVTGISAGKVTITVRVFDANNKRLASGSADITVIGGRSSSDSDYGLDRDDDSSSSSSTKSSSSSTSGGTSANSGGKISAATVVNAVRNAVVSGRTTSATFRGYSSVSAATLKSAATEMQRSGGTVLLNFDTMSTTKANSVEGRVTVNPRGAAGLENDVQLGVYTNANATGKTRTKFEKYFSNRVVIIKASQKGSYGMSVSYAVKIGTELANSKQLMLYSYNPDNNKYYEVKNSNIWIDTKGYVHFTTHLGDDLVISDGKLTKR